ncbi:MAG: VOC family protein [Pyrinomonadaceae bacterium]
MSEQTATAEQTKQMPRHGEICWNELATNDSEAARKFYGELFGWKFETHNMECQNEQQNEQNTGMAYTELSLDGKKQFGGMYQITKEMGEMKPNWINYIAVDNVDESAAKVGELGGKICLPPMDIPNVGRFCVITDPSGATFSMITMKSA